MICYACQNTGVALDGHECPACADAVRAMIKKLAAQGAPKCDACNGTRMVWFRIGLFGGKWVPCTDCLPTAHGTYGESGANPVYEQVAERAVRKMQHGPDIINEVLTVVWSTVRATGETTLRVILGDKVGSWTVTRYDDRWFRCEKSPEGYAGFNAHDKAYAVEKAVQIMGDWK